MAVGSHIVGQMYRQVDPMAELLPQAAGDSTEEGDVCCHSVMVCSLHGESLNLVLEACTTASKLKEKIADEWLIPPIFQRLVITSAGLDARDLPDDGLIEDACYTMILSFVKVDEKLCKGPMERVDAFTALGLLGSRGGENAIAAVCDGLKDGQIYYGHSDVQQAAAKALAKITAKNDNPSVITALCDRLGHGEIQVRYYVIHALTKVAERGDQNAVNGVCNQLKKKCSLPVMGLLEMVAEKGDQNAIAAACTHLESQLPDVRKSALNVLAQVAETGDQNAIDAVQNCLKNRDSRVRTDALETLPKIAKEGDQSVITAVRHHLEEEDPHVRHAAAKAYKALAHASDPSATATVVPVPLRPESDDVLNLAWVT